MTTPTRERGDPVPAAEDVASASAEPCQVRGAQAGISRKDFQELPPIPSLRRHPLGAAAWLLKGMADCGSLAVLLALAAAIPVVNLFAFGYLMETQARVAVTGKIRSAFYLLPAAGRLGGIGLGVTLWLLPIRFLAGVARDSQLISPGGTATWMWAAALAGAALLVTAHLLLAIGCGGDWWRFLRPVSNVRQLRRCWQNDEYWRGAQRAICELLAALRLPHLLWLGLIGYAATYAWLTLPTCLFTMLDDVTNPFQVMAFLVGGALMTLVLMWLPLLLAHVASQGRWQAIFETATVLKLAGRTPFRWVMATAILLACSVLPLLYTALLKNRIPPHAARWDLMLVCLACVVPGRVLVGWVYHRASQRTGCSSSWPWRIWQCVNSAALAIGVGGYVYFLYLAQTGGELGQQAVWQFHALLLPFPW